MTREAFSRCVDRAIAMTDIISAAVIILMMAYVTLDVGARFFGLGGMYGTIDIVSYWYMPVIAFLPLAAVERQEGHISVNILEELGITSLTRIGVLLAKCLSVIFYLIVGYITWLAAVEQQQIGAFVMGTDAVTIWPTYYILPVGFLLMALVLSLRLLGLLVSAQQNIEQTEDARA